METVILSYNRQHNQDQSIPQWIVKYKGETHYINHLDSTVGFSTKETPLNEHTKGSIKFKANNVEFINNNVILS